MVVGLQALHHGPSFIEQLNEGHEQGRPHNVEEAQLGAGHAALLIAIHEGADSQTQRPLFVSLPTSHTCMCQPTLSLGK